MRIVALFMIVWLCGLPVGAGAQPSRSALILGKTDPQLLKRIEGQTADLQWSLIVDETVVAPDMNRAVEAASEHNVSAAIWFETLPDGSLTVNLVQVATGKVFQRRVEKQNRPAALSGSAIAEAAALVVRSALVALSESEQNAAAMAETPETRATPQTETAAAETPPAEKKPGAAETAAAEKPAAEIKPETGALSAPQPPATAATAEPSTQTQSQSSFAMTTRWQLAAGWHLAVDGQSPAGQQGPLLRLGFEIGPVELGLWGMLTLPDDLKDRELIVSLRRYGLLASIGYTLIDDSTLRLVSDLAAGVLFFRRSTKALVATLKPEPPSSVKSLILQWDARFQWFPGWLKHVLGLELALAAAMVPAAPVISVKELDKVVERHRTWVVQPAGHVALVGRTSEAR